MFADAHMVNLVNPNLETCENLQVMWLHGHINKTYMRINPLLGLWINNCSEDPSQPNCVHAVLIMSISSGSAAFTGDTLCNKYPPPTLNSLLGLLCLWWFELSNWLKLCMGKEGEGPSSSSLNRNVYYCSQLFSASWMHTCCWRRLFQSGAQAINMHVGNSNWMQPLSKLACVILSWCYLCN